MCHSTYIKYITSTHIKSQQFLIKFSSQRSFFLLFCGTFDGSFCVIGKSYCASKHKMSKRNFQNKHQCQIEVKSSQKHNQKTMQWHFLLVCQTLFYASSLFVALVDFSFLVVLFRFLFIYFTAQSTWLLHTFLNTFD